MENLLAKSSSAIFRQGQFNGTRRLLRLPTRIGLEVVCLSRGTGRGTFTVKNIGNWTDNHPTRGKDCTMTISQEILDRLAEFDTPTICNVIELFDVRPRNQGYMDHRIQCGFPELPPMVGFATTACFRADAPPAGGDAYGSIQAQLASFEQLPGPPVVVFQDQDDPPVAAVFGEVMCSTYQAFGSTGLITNGAGRDLEQVRALGSSVFTGSTICSHGYCHMLQHGRAVPAGDQPYRDGVRGAGKAGGDTVCRRPGLRGLCPHG